MREKEPRPVVTPSVESDGIIRLDVAPVSAIRGLRSCIDNIRDVGLNFAAGSAAPDHLYVSVSPEKECALAEELSKFGILNGTIQISQRAA